MTTAIAKLKEHLAEIADLHVASGVLGWDQQTYMPPGGGPRRAEVMGTLSRLAHTKFTSEETVRLLDAAATEVESLPADSDDACLVRIVRRDYEKSRKLPDEFVAAQTRDAILSNEVWRHARLDNDFAAFQPHLIRMVDYARRQADLYGYEAHPYDALLDDYEPELTTADVRRVFGILKAEQVPLVQKCAASPQPRTDFLHRECPEERQGQLGLHIVSDFGYDLKRGRLDVAPHPFETSFGRDDVRITTRYDRRFPQQAIFGIFHEAGHALYEQNVSPSLARTPLSAGASMVFHESQSRLWENIVGRSRALWQHYFPMLRSLFPDAFSDVTAEEFYRAINRVEPSLIRVEADEATYNLHIMLRFDLETALMSNELSVAELPEAWRAKMQEYFGIAPPNDRDGVMQDTHWSSGSFGYFPTYALGNVMAAQIYDTALQAHPEITDEIGQGRFATLLDWLAEHLYQHGRKFLPRELAPRVTGRPLDPQPYIAYLKAKFGELYGV
ncbi:MAG: carboxypeptidase M32, partial [Armatimonadota bacterium]|nr:carboxypeptidase M32 [Armatimonadota bacterium]